MKTTALLVLGLMAAALAFTDSASLEHGQELYLENKPAEAKPLLEQALNENPADEKIYLYLGIVDQQLGLNDQAITILKRGAAISTELKDLFFFNIGNNFFRQGQFTFAEEMYSNAVTANAKLAQAYLNRANARLKLENFNAAADDYALFLQLKPDDSQKPQIEEVIKLLQQAIAAREQKKKEEEERQKALMNEVLNSLSNSSEDTRNLSVESLHFKQDSEDVDIKD